MSKIELKACSFCGDSGQIVESKTEFTYICAIYCADCLNSKYHGYIYPDTIVYGWSLLSRRKARKKAIKNWNRRDYDDKL